MSKPAKTSPKTPITPSAVARVQRVVAKDNGGAVPKGNHVGRMQRAAAKSGNN